MKRIFLPFFACWLAIAAQAQSQPHPLDGSSWLCNKKDCLDLGGYRVKILTFSVESQEFITGAIYSDGVANLVADFKLKISGQSISLKTVFSSIENTPPKGAKFKLTWELNKAGDKLTLIQKGKKYVYDKVLE